MKRSGIATVAVEPVAPAPAPTATAGPSAGAASGQSQIAAQTAATAGR